MCLDQVIEAWSGILTGPKPTKAQVLGCINGAQKRGIASVLGSSPQKYRPSEHE